MSATLKWKAEVTFEGTMEQFQAFKAAIEKQPVGISVSELGGGVIKPRPRPGYISPAIFAAIEKDPQFQKLIEGQPRMQFVSIKDIRGGIRNPHLHLGDEVILVDKERFKAILGEAARNIFELRATTEEDYCNMVMPLVGG